MGEAIAGPSRLRLRLRGAASIDAAFDDRSTSTSSTQRQGKRSLQRLPLRCDPKVEMSPSLCAQSYATLDHPRHALHLLCYDVHALGTRPYPGSVRTFLHRKRPTLYAHIVGHIVGVELRENKVAWLVDDGTAVVAVHYTYNLKPVAQEAVVPLTSDKKGKRKAKDDDLHIQHGIPAQYVRPRTLPLMSPAHDRVGTSVLKDEKCFEKSIKHLTVCTLVDVVGRVDSRFREHVVIVDRVMPPNVDGDDMRFRSARDGFIKPVRDVNEEAKHALLAIELAEGEYDCALPHDTDKPYNSHQTNILRDWNGQKDELPMDFCSVKKLLRLDDGQQVEKSEETRPPSPTSSCQKSNAPRGLVASSSIPSLPRKRSRRLRDYHKLAEHDLTEQLLRIYVQKHLVDNCSKPPATTKQTDPEVVFISDSSSDEDQTGYKRRHSSRAESFAVPTNHAHDLASPAFALEYLLRVKHLYGLARRIVDVEQKRRERRRLRAGRPARESTRSESDIIRRLFEVVVRHVVLDGMIVVADAAQVTVQSPFDGKRPEQDDVHRVDPDGLLFWDESSVHEGSLRFTATPARSSSDADLSLLRWRDGGRKKVDVYQLVTSALLAPAVLSIMNVEPVQEREKRSKGGRRLGTTKRADESVKGSARLCLSSSSRDRYNANRIHRAIRETTAEQVAHRLRATDDRWQRIRVDSIAECFVYLQEKYPID